MWGGGWPATFWGRNAEAETVLGLGDAAESGPVVVGHKLGHVSVEGFGQVIGIPIQNCQQDLLSATLDLPHHLEEADGIGQGMSQW